MSKENTTLSQVNLEPDTEISNNAPGAALGTTLTELMPPPSNKITGQISSSSSISSILYVKPDSKAEKKSKIKNTVIKAKILKIQ